MINKEWEDFFGIEEASDPSYIETDFNIKQKDAVAVLASCVNANGCVDLNWMCEASGLSLDELIHSLHGAIYQDPEVYDLCRADDQGWMLRAQYLSGHIKSKLETAKRLNHKYDNRFASNVAALKSIMPSKSDFDAIGFSIGSPWIPNEYYEAFAPDGKEGREYNAEEIYQMLIHQNHANRISQMQSRPNHTNGASQMQADQNNTNGVSQMQTDSNNANKSSQIQTDNGKSEKSSFDRHDIWQGICDKIQLQDSWNKKIQSAFRQCGDSTGMPQHVRTIVQDIARRSGLNWKQILHDFLQSDTYDYNFLPPDRRYAFSDFYLPAYNMDEEHQTANDIWVCIDTSGSVTEEELTCTMAEILDAMRQAGLKGSISFFDSNITEPEPFESENDLKDLTAQGGGGTSFHIIFRYLKEKLYPNLPRAILIFTDGCARFPDEKEAFNVPVLWLICKGGNADVPWGQVIQL